MTELSHAERIAGLDRRSLFDLRDQIDTRIKHIEESGKVKLWVVSGSFVNWYYDTSYERAKLYLIHKLQEESKFDEDFELRSKMIYQEEFAEYEKEYGALWRQYEAMLHPPQTDTEAFNRLSKERFDWDSAPSLIQQKYDFIPTEKEYEALDYLINEWDYGYWTYSEQRGRNENDI